jgi:hypothetical protein
MIAARDVATGEVDVGRRNHTDAQVANYFVALGVQATWERAVCVHRAFWRGGNRCINTDPIGTQQRRDDRSHLHSAHCPVKWFA